jgi:hypothetical protein
VPSCLPGSTISLSFKNPCQLVSFYTYNAFSVSALYWEEKETAQRTGHVTMLLPSDFNVAQVRRISIIIAM